MRPARFVTATVFSTVTMHPSISFAAILQDQGAEVIHLGHNRSAEKL